MTDRTLTILGDQPISDQSGRPTMYFVNYMQRLTAFIGSPSSGGGTSGSGGLTIQEQISEVSSQVANLVQIVGSVSGNVRHGLTPYQLAAMQAFGA